MTSPLAGLKVVELARILAGPWAGQTLSDLGAEVVIAINVGTPLRTADEIGNALTIVEQMTSLAIVANTNASLASMTDEDVLITPQLGNDINGEAAEDSSGWAVDISADGNTVVIGAARNDGNGNAQINFLGGAIVLEGIAQNDVLIGGPVSEDDFLF